MVVFLFLLFPLVIYFQYIRNILAFAFVLIGFDRLINKKKAYNQNNPYGPSFSAYVTYSKPMEASIAILALDDTVVDNHLIRASFGTTKYCSFYLKNMVCTNKDCLFLHRKADESDIIKREDLNVNKNIFYEQQLYAIKIADIYNPEVKKKMDAFAIGYSHYKPSITSVKSKIISKKGKRK